MLGFFNTTNIDGLVKSHQVCHSREVTKYVIPAKAGIYKYLKILDPRLRGDDKTSTISTFYESINITLRIRMLDKIDTK